VEATTRSRTSVASGLTRETLLVAAAILAYFSIRNQTAGAADDAVRNAGRLLDLEERLGICWEASLQAAIESSDVLVTAANWVYIWGHWPVILTTAAALYLWRRDSYYTLRNAMFVSAAIGFLFFGLFPVAPPRLLDLGLVDTVTEYSRAYRTLQPPGLTNQYAAFPSLHVGWNLLVGIALLRASRHMLVRAFAVTSPAAMALAVVVTANHFVVDVAAGIAVVLVGLAAAHAIATRRRISRLEAVGSQRIYRPHGAPRRTHSVRRRPPSRQSPRSAARR
jgi:hypothetical protein